LIYGSYTNNSTIIALINRYVVMADWIFTAPSIVIQPITGVLMIGLVNYSFSYFWIYGSIIAYSIAVCCWIPVVFLQYKMRNIAMKSLNKNELLPREYYYYFKIWFLLRWPAFLSFLIVFYLMTFKPIHGFGG